MSTNKSEDEVLLVYDSDYFKLNKVLQIFSGLWPFTESRVHSLSPKIIVYSLLALLSIPIVRGARISCFSDMGYCAECIGGLCYILGFILKYLTTDLAAQKFQLVYLQIAMNWLETTTPEEHAILEKCAKTGNLITKVYVGLVIVSGFAFCNLPMIPVYLDFILPLNHTREKLLVVRGEYIVDPFDYFFEIYVIISLTSITTLGAILSVDTMFSQIIYQTVGMINVVKFIELINKTFSFTFLAYICGSVLYLSFGIVTTAHGDYELLDFIRYVVFIIGVVGHLLYYCNFCQILYDHTSDLFESIYCIKWYNLPVKSRKLILIMMSRCIRPSIITAGGILDMNIMSFGMIMKAVVSYATVLSTFH